MARARGLTTEAAIYATCTTFFGAVMAATTKLAGTRISTEEQICLQSILGIAASSALGNFSFGALRRSQESRWLVARGALGFAAVVCYLEAVRKMPLTLVALVTRLHLPYIAVFARLQFQEALRPQQVIGILLASTGASLVAPSETWIVNTTAKSGFQYILFATIFTSLGFLSVQNLSKRGEDMATVCTAFHVVSLVAGLLQTLRYGFKVPTLHELGYVGVTAVATSAMQWGVSNLYRKSTVVDTLPIFFLLPVVFSVIFDVLQGTPVMPSYQEEIIGAALILAAVVIGCYGIVEARMTEQEGQKDA